MARKMKSMDGNTAAARTYRTRLPKLRVSIRSPRPAPWRDSVDQWAAAGQKNIFGTTVKVIGNAVRGRCGGYRTRLSGSRCAHYHLHRISGSSADDPEYVQDRRRAASLCIPRFRSYRCILMH